MANRILFSSTPGRLPPVADATNLAGGRAYQLSPKEELAQYVCTGCLRGTFYVTDAHQLEKVLQLVEEVPAEFIGKLAIYARERAFMKDMPALLCAVLAKKDPAVLSKVFARVIDNGKMFQNFAQIVRSGVVGRKSFGTRIRREMRNWLQVRTDEDLLWASIGANPSLGDIVRMVHPKPNTLERAAMYEWLIGKGSKRAVDLPECIKVYETYKTKMEGAPPRVPFQMLTQLHLGPEQWMKIAERASWAETRMNLNTFQRHGVFDSAEMVKTLADRLRDPARIKKARAFPYQLMSAYVNVHESIPLQLREALQDAMEIALENVPELKGPVVVCPDVSGSMSSPITGGTGKQHRSKVRCIDVAALVAAALLRKNPETRVIPFEGNIVRIQLNPRDSVMTNAQKLAAVGGGSTNCSAPLAFLKVTKAKIGTVVYVSDTESWVDSLASGNGIAFGGSRQQATQTLIQWEQLRPANPDAKMVCIDIQATSAVQAPSRQEILNVGGWSDTVFDVIANFSNGKTSGWLDEIEQVDLG